LYSPLVVVLNVSNNPASRDGLYCSFDWLACLLGVKHEMGRVELLGFIEKKGSRAKGSKTNDRKVARTDDRVDTSLPLLIFPFILSDPLRWVENQ